MPSTNPPRDLLWAWKVVKPDFTTRYGFQWPSAGKWVQSDDAVDPGNDTACPTQRGDGLCLAKTFRGAASSNIVASTALVVGYRPEDVLGEDAGVIRVRRAYVVHVFDVQEAMRMGVFRNADLRGADLCEANLVGADLSGADLRGAILSDADLRGANLRRANLLGADLGRANLVAADLSAANLRVAELGWADLRAADLSNAILNDADLSHAALRGAELGGADLRGADLRTARLRGARLTLRQAGEAQLTWKQRQDVIIVEPNTRDQTLET